MWSFKVMAADDFELPKLPEIGDWVNFYPHCKTNRDPAPAIVTAKPTPNGNVSLTAFLPNHGPYDSLCFPAGSPMITSSDIKKMGCWTPKTVRLDQEE